VRWLRKAIVDPFIILTTLILWFPTCIGGAIDRVAGTGIAAAIIRWWSRRVYWIIGVRVTCEGLEHIDPSRNHVILCNHSSFLDGPALIIALPLDFGFLVKRSVTRVRPVRYAEGRCT